MLNYSLLMRQNFVVIGLIFFCATPLLSKLEEGEAKNENFKFQIWKISPKWKSNDKLVGETLVPFQKLLSNHTSLPTATSSEFCFTAPLLKKEIQKGTLELAVEATGT